MAEGQGASGAYSEAVSFSQVLEDICFFCFRMLQITLADT